MKRIEGDFVSDGNVIFNDEDVIIEGNLCCKEVFAKNITVAGNYIVEVDVVSGDQEVGGYQVVSRSQKVGGYLS